jgi:hypothetical protein
MERRNGTALTDRYQKAVHYAIKKGINNVRSISEATGIEEDAVRRSCRQLYRARQDQARGHRQKARWQRADLGTCDTLTSG